MSGNARRRGRTGDGSGWIGPALETTRKQPGDGEPGEHPGRGRAIRAADGQGGLHHGHYFLAGDGGMGGSGRGAKSWGSSTT